MKNIFTLALFLMTILAVNSCSSVDNTPEAVAEAVIEALYEEDVDKMLDNMAYIDALGDIYDVRPLKESLGNNWSDDSFIFQTRESCFHWGWVFKRKSFDPSLFKFVLAEVSEDGNRAVTIYVPNEYFTDEVKAQIKARPWYQKWGFGGLSLQLVKNPDGKWKVLKARYGD